MFSRLGSCLVCKACRRARVNALDAVTGCAP